jgi:hypothetical protein
MITHKLPSGTVLDVTPLPYDEAWEITRQAIGIVERLKIDISGMTSLKEINAADVLRFKDPICLLLSAPEVVPAAKQCLAKCTYGGKKIDNMSFEDAKARGDYLFAIFYALYENIAPFFVAAISFFTET